jgi:uncharacterized membrane protein HdeD (DUF308 family)
MGARLWLYLFRLVAYRDSLGRVKEMATEVHPGVREAGKNWWLLLFWGVAMIILGLYLIFQPGMTALVLVQVMAVFWVVGGIFDVAGAIVNSQDEHRLWRIVTGIISIVAGGIILLNPLFGTFLVLTFQFYLLAFGAIIIGIINIVGWNRTPGSHWSLGSTLLGILQVLIGIFLLAHPIFGVLALLTVFGVLAIVAGAGAIAMSWRVKTMTGN